MRARVVIPGRLGQRGEGRRGEGRGLGDVQVARGFPEEHLRGRFHPKDVRPEGNLVEIQLEDRVFAEVALQLHRHPRFAQLASQLLFPPQALGEDVAGQLHRNRGEPLRVMQRQDVGLERAEDAPVVDAVVLVKPLVLDRDERLAHVHGDLVERQDGAQLDAELADQAAIGGIDLGGLQLLVPPAPRVDPHDAGAALRRAHPRPRAVHEAAGIEQGQYGRDNRPPALDGIVPPADQNRAAKGGGRWRRRRKSHL